MTNVTQERSQFRTAAAPGTARRWQPASGAAFAVLIVIGNGLYTDSDSQALGYGIELAGYAVFAIFLAWIASTLGRIGRNAAALAVIGGTTMLAVKLTGWAAVMASENGDLTRAVSDGLVQLDEAAFVLAWLPYGLFVIGLAVAALQADRLGPVVARIGVVIGVGCIVAVPFSSTDPFVVPWLISLLWLVTASTLLERGHRRLARDERGGGQPWSVEV